MKTKDEPKASKGRLLRKIIIDNPEPPVAFQETLQGWEPKFPCLMVPWGGGQPIIYNIEDQNTYFKVKPPTWWHYPDTHAHLAGEEYRLGMGALKLIFAFRHDAQINAASWLINDIYLPDLDANARMFQMVNLGPQPEGVLIARPVQVSNAEYFNQYLAQFKESGYIGALVRDPKSMYDDPQYAVIQEV